MINTAITYRRGSWRRAACVVMLVSCAPLVFSTSVLARSLEEAKKSGKIIAGVSGDNPPFGFVDTSGTQQGYDAEIHRAFAKSLGLEVQFSQLSLAARIPSLVSRKVDILIAGLGMTQERAKSVQFTVPYLETKMYVVAAKPVKIAASSDLSKFVLGTPRSSTLDTMLTAVAPKGSDIRRFDDDPASIQALLSGQVEAIAANQFTVEKLEERSPGTYDIKLLLGNVWYGGATRLGEKDWNHAFNSFFLKFRTTDEFRSIYRKWMKSDVPSFPEEIEGISFEVK